MLVFKTTFDKLEVYADFVVQCDKYTLKLSEFKTKPVFYNTLIKSIPLSIYKLTQAGEPHSLVLKVWEQIGFKKKYRGKIVIHFTLNKSILKRNKKRVLGDVHITKPLYNMVELSHKTDDEVAFISPLNLPNLEFFIYYRPYKKAMVYLDTIKGNLKGVFTAPEDVFKVKPGVELKSQTILQARDY